MVLTYHRSPPGVFLNNINNVNPLKDIVKPSVFSSEQSPLSSVSSGKNVLAVTSSPDDVRYVISRMPSVRMRIQVTPLVLLTR